MWNNMNAAKCKTMKTQITMLSAHTHPMNNCITFHKHAFDSATLWPRSRVRPSSSRTCVVPTSRDSARCTFARRPLSTPTTTCSSCTSRDARTNAVDARNRSSVMRGLPVRFRLPPMTSTSCCCHSFRLMEYQQFSLI